MSDVYTKRQVDNMLDWLKGYGNASYWARGELGTVREAIDADQIARQRAWSDETFGPGPRTAGVIDHIRKELDEVADAPTDPNEWADIIILALDGATRAGITPQRIIDAVVAKHAVNEARTWPDWRTADPGKAIEHDRSAELADLRDALNGPDLDMFVDDVIDRAEIAGQS